MVRVLRHKASDRDQYHFDAEYGLMTAPKNASHPLDIPLKPEFANAFWKIMVKTRGLRGALWGSMD